MVFLSVNAHSCVQISTIVGGSIDGRGKKFMGEIRRL